MPCGPDPRSEPHSSRATPILTIPTKNQPAHDRENDAPTFGALETGKPGSTAEVLHKRLPLILLVAAIAAVAYFAWAAASDLSVLKEAMHSITGVQLLVVFLLSVANYALRYLRWRVLLQELGHRIPERMNIAYYLAGFAFTATPGKAGEAIRTLYLMPHGVSPGHSIGALVVDRLSDLIAIALLALLLFLPFEIVVALTVLTGLAWAVLAMLKRRFASNLTWPSVRIPFLVRIGRRLDGLASVAGVAARLLHPRLFAFSLAIGFVAWAAEGYGLYVFIAAMGGTLQPALAVGTYAASILIGVVSLLPGGLGSTEAAMSLLLTHHGVTSGMAIAATILCRVATLWFAVWLGLAAAVWLSARKPKVAGVSIP
jgi:glycosyltransferase 2 family protein